MITVVRIENRGVGMFINNELTLKEISYETKLWWGEIALRHEKFNTPQADGLNLCQDDKEWFCAYKSVDQLKEWISTEEIKKLTKYGFKVMMFDVNEYQEGRDQIIFTRESILSQKDVTSLFI